MRLKPSDFEPTRGKVVSTLAIYLALLLGSLSKVLIFKLFNPALKEMVLEQAKSAVRTPEYFSMRYNTAFIFYILTSAAQLLFIYLAVCIIYKFAKQEKKR